MAFSTTSLSGIAARERSATRRTADRSRVARLLAGAWQVTAEALLVAAAIGLVFPWFGLLASHDARDGRFRGEAIAVRGLPAPISSDMCAAYGSLVEPVVMERLCGHTRLAAAPASVERMPVLLASAIGRAKAAFTTPVQDAQTRIAQLRDQQREGVGDMLALGHAIDTAMSEIEPFLDRYQMDGDLGAGPRPLACAAEAVRATLAKAPVDRTGETLRANALLLLAGALDGQPAVSALVNVAALPDTHASAARCQDLSLAEALSATAALIGEARDAQLAQTKDRAMRELLAAAQWHWLGAMILLWALLNAIRRIRSPAIALAVCLCAWGIAAWAGRVPWPFAGRHSFVLGRESASFVSMPAPYVLALLAAALCVLFVSPWMRTTTRAQRPASVFVLPGFVLATGIGFVVLLDLSANGHFANRYLALYHEGHLWLALLAFSIAGSIRQPLGRAVAWTLALVDGVATRVTASFGSIVGGTLLLACVLAFTAVLATALANLRQLTSELGRLWLIVGAAWFFFLRGTPLTQRLAQSGNSLTSLVRYASPLAFVVAVLIGAMLFTQDMGPLLIAGYGAGALVAAALAMWWHQRTGRVVSAYALAAVLFVAWIATTTIGLFSVAAYDEVAAARLENATAPLASANDHLALVTWFQRSAPPSGYGPGAVPWCGYGASGGCAGVPAQIQSDYTFTALVGTFGWTAAWCITLGLVAWLYLVVRGHARVTTGEPRLVRAGQRMVNDEQGLLSWLCVSWMALTLCQLAVTVAGNLAVIPLTGVTFPFVSFGMASLVSNSAMLGLAASVSEARDG